MRSHNRIQAGVVALWGAALVIPVAARGQTVADPRLAVQIVVSGLAQPTAMEFLGPDEFLVCEKASGRIWRVAGGQLVDVVLDLPVANDATRGLLGLALHPEFAANGRVFAFYSLSVADGGPWLENRVSRFVYDGQRIDPASELVVARFTSDAAQNNAPACEGGVLRFGPDGLLYGSIGDLGRGGFENPRLEQNSGAEQVANSGGIFRIAPDGSIPPENPFVQHPDVHVQRLFAYGVRNTYGLDFDPRTGALWATENGPEVFDEINRVPPGMNSGWLKIMGPDAYDAVYGKNLYTAYDAEDLVQIPGAQYVDPALSFFHPLGLTALRFVESEQYPCGLQGAMLVGDTNTGRLYRLELTPDRETIALDDELADGVADSIDETAGLVFGEGWGVTTDLKFGPDGLLYVVSLTRGQVFRIRPVGPRADLDGNVQVDLADLQALLASYRLDAGGDLDCDGDTDLADLSLMLEALTAR